MTSKSGQLRLCVTVKTQTGDVLKYGCIIKKGLQLTSTQGTEWMCLILLHRKGTGILSSYNMTCGEQSHSIQCIEWR